MASLHEFLTIGRAFKETKPTPRSLPLTGHRHPRGAVIPVSVCAGVLLLVAVVITLGVALRA